MIAPPIADGLNEKQQQSVVLSEDINALILAGAGSGKNKSFNPQNSLSGL